MYWQLFGIVGLLFLIVGVLLKKRTLQDEFYTLGGVFLLVYSVSIQDWIFIVLQIIFVAVAIYDVSRKRKNKA